MDDLPVLRWYVPQLPEVITLDRISVASGEQITWSVNALVANEFPIFRVNSCKCIIAS